MPTQGQALSSLEEKLEAAKRERALASLREKYAEKRKPGILEQVGTGAAEYLAPGSYAFAAPETGEEARRGFGTGMRIMGEIGAGVAATQLTGGAAAPAWLARLAQTSKVLRTAVRGLITGGAEAATGLAMEPAAPTEEPLMTAATTAALGGTAEFAGPAVRGVWGKLRRGGTKLVEGGAEAVEDALELRRAGLTTGIVTPGQVSRNRAVDVVESMSRGSILGGGNIVAAAEDVAEAQRGVIHRFIQRFAGRSSREGVEDLVAETLADRGDAFREVARQMYSGVDLLRSEVKVDLLPILDEARRLAGRGLGDPQMNKVVRSLEAKIKEMGSAVTFAEAAAIRSDLLAIGRGGQELIKGKAQGAGKRLAGMIDAKMEDAARVLDGEALQAWRRANKFWKDGKKVFNSKLIRNLTKQDPQSVYSAAVKNKSPREIKKVRDLILHPEKFGLTDVEPNPQLWREVQGQWLVDAADRASKGEAGELAGKPLRRVLKQMGDDALHALFPNAEDVSLLKRAARSLEIFEGGIGEGIPGRIFIQLRQATTGAQALSFVFGVSGTLDPGDTMLILGGPAVASRLFTNEKFVRWATIGTGAKIGSEESYRAMTQIAAMAIAAGGRAIRGDEYLEERGAQRLRERRSALPTPLRSTATLGGPRAIAP